MSHFNPFGSARRGRNKCEAGEGQKEDGEAETSKGGSVKKS